MQLRTPFGGSVGLSANQVQTASLAQDGLPIDIFRTEPTNAFNGKLQKSGVCL
jgi:hypothetical protein